MKKMKFKFLALILFIFMVLPFISNISYAEEMEIKSSLSNLITNSVNKIYCELKPNTSLVENVGFSFNFSNLYWDKIRQNTKNDKTKRYNYTGHTEGYQVYKTGLYKIEAFGGGAAGSSDGKGGQSVRYIFLAQGDKLLIDCGQECQSADKQEYASAYPDGGKAGKNGSSGAGSTRIFKADFDEGIDGRINKVNVLDTIIYGGGSSLKNDGGGLVANSGNLEEENGTYIQAFSGGSQSEGGKYLSPSVTDAVKKKITNSIAYASGTQGHGGNGNEAISINGKSATMKYGNGGGGGYYGGAATGWKVENGTIYTGNSATGGSSYIGNQTTVNYQGVTYTSFTKSGVNTGNGYAIITYIPRVYSVTLNTNGGTIGSGNITQYTEGTGATLPTNVTRSGYTFAGWYEKSDFSGNKINSISSSDTGNKTFYAKWTPVTYTLSYELNGGVVSKANPTTYSIETATFTLNNPTKDGYTFTGWTGSCGNTPIMAVTITKGSTGDKTYIANWELNKTDPGPNPSPTPSPTPSPSPDSKIELKSIEYTIGDKYISRVVPYMENISEGTTASTFKKNIEVTEGANIEILGLDGNAISDNDLVSSGMILKITKDTSIIELTIIVIGDTDGDGKLTANDLDRELDLLVERDMTGKNLNEEIMRMAVDLDFDGKGATANDTDIMLDAIVGKIDFKNH